ncbi:pentapeptide repeat-containing protein [Mycobacteroides chelonae]|uniref:pentapeptide repeat-containing protein n=1 Tax=Mycobacteroides chelonae TaxID=1774 RepID=UPI0009BEA685|nr:pentapeptide repeat-containing protein [Mycobacteroides chelonae]AYM42056.1 hypothetical protein DYE20_11255 [[Mycobacterium] chelonae subsp. gwanakae]
MSHQDNELDHLKDRWDDETTHFAIESLLRGRAVSPHGTHQGRVDLRGLVISAPERVRLDENFSRIAKLYEFQGVEIRDIDASHATLPEWRVIGSSFENCIFDHSKLASFRAYSAVFKQCSFKSSDLREASLGGRAEGRKSRGGLYEDCDFSGADLRGVSTDPGRFTACNFQWTKWKNTRFLSTVLESCDFRYAYLERVFFDGRLFRDNAPTGLGENKLLHCDFSSAELRDTTFLAIDFRNCIAPTGDDFALVDHYPRRVEDALSYLKARSGQDASIAAMVLDADAQSAKFLPDDSVGLVQFEHYPGSGRELIAEAFGLVTT